MPKVVTGYSEEFRAKVLTEYAAGASVFSLSRKHGIAGGTIQGWVDRAGITRGGRLAEDTRQEIGSMVQDYLRANLRAMTAVAEHVADKEWLMGQHADGLALIVSTLHDKTVHLLSSMQANAEAANQLMEQGLTEDGNHLLPTHPEYVDPETLNVEVIDQAGTDDELYDQT